jgi:hypothetical protein
MERTHATEAVILLIDNSDAMQDALDDILEKPDIVNAADKVNGVAMYLRRYTEGAIDNLDGGNGLTYWPVLKELLGVSFYAVDWRDVAESVLLDRDDD